MALFFTQFMNGIGNGAIYASLALALVLIYKTTGILNFAQGEMALVLDVHRVEVHRRGTCRCGSRSSCRWCSRSSVVRSIERVVIRPVERSSPLVIVIVTIGLFLALNSLDAAHLRQRARRCCRARTRSTPGTSAASDHQSNTLVLVGVLARRVRVCCICCCSGRSSGSRSAAVASQPRVEPAARRAGRHDADGRLGPGRRGRCAGRCRS